MSMIDFSELRPIAFIDRDGVINEERNYVSRIDDFVILPGVIEGLALLQNAGFQLVIITNQSGIARGYYDEIAVNQLHTYLRERLFEHNILLSGIYFCPHHPQGKVLELSISCDCRKPGTGMLVKAANDLNSNLSKSVLIGDKVSDIQAGINAGVRTTVIVESGHVIDLKARLLADIVAANLLEAAKLLVELKNHSNL